MLYYNHKPNMRKKERDQMLSPKKKLPIDIENFAELQTEEFYYVDKTNLIRELLEHWAKVNLFTRPRRFGKSLNMSKVILLIDEYDVPLAKAFERGYYDQMVLFIRNLFEYALKTNDSLKFAVLTGCRK